MINLLKKIVLLFLLLNSLFIFTESIASESYIGRNIVNIPSSKNITKEKQAINLNNYGIIGTNNFKFELGFFNKLQRDSFNKINIKFDHIFEGKIIVYEKSFYRNRNSRKKFYKEIKVSGEEINTFIYLEDGEYSFYLEDNNVKKIFFNSNTDWLKILYLFDNSENIIKSDFYLDNVENPFLLTSLVKLVILKKKLSNVEIKNIKSFIFKGGIIYISENIYKNNFLELVENNFLEKKYIKYNNKGKFYPYPYYNYGFGNIIIIGDDDVYKEDLLNRLNFKNYRYIKNNSYESGQILIDDVIKSKFIPFNLILIFIILYFLVIIPINFYIYKKKDNKFFLLYSVPLISISFILILFILNFIYKGTNDIENKIQINYHKDGMVLNKVYILTFARFGGDHNIKIEKEDYISNRISYYTFSDNKRKYSFEDNKIDININNILSSSLIGYNYEKTTIEKGRGKIKKENNIYLNKEKIFEIKQLFKNGNIINNIEVSETKTEYMKKYSFGGESNLNLVIDIYFK